MHRYAASTAILAALAASAGAQTKISDWAAAGMSADSNWVLLTQQFQGPSNLAAYNVSNGSTHYYGGTHVGLAMSNGGLALFQEADGTFAVANGSQRTTVALNGAPANLAGDGLHSSMDAATGVVDATNVDSSGAFQSYEFAPDGGTSPLPYGSGDVFLAQAGGTSYAYNSAGGLDAYRGGAFVALPAQGGTPYDVRPDADGRGAIALTERPESVRGLATYSFDGSGARSHLWDFGDGGTVTWFSDLYYGSGIVATTAGTYLIDANFDTFRAFSLPAGYTLADGFSRSTGIYADLTDTATGQTSFWNLTAQPVPEPAPLAALGLGALAAFRRKRPRD